MDQTHRRFYTITAAAFLVIFLFAAIIFVYTEGSYVKIEVTGTSNAYFIVSYDSTNATIPFSRNVTVEVLPHVNVTITAYPNATYSLSTWHTSGAQVLRTGNDTISLLTGQGGDTIKVSAVLVAKPSGSG